MKYYLGIDLGTSSIKVSLADEKGNIIDSESSSYPLILPKPNWSEQDPNEWRLSLIEVLLNLNKRHDLSKVASLSFSGQMHGLVLLDKNDEVIRPALLWNDSRTVKEVDYLNNEIGMDKLLEETSNIALCGFTAPKLLWVYNNEKSNFSRIEKIMLPKDYLSYIISKSFASDVSDLSGTLFFDVKKRDYSEFMLDILHIKRSQLPRVYDSFQVVGHVNEEFSRLTNLPTSCKVVIGGGDQAVGATGTNTLKSGDISISLGTSGVVFAPSKSYCFDKTGRIHSFRHTTGQFHLMGCTLSAMGSLKWFLEDILSTKDYDKEIDSINEDISDIIFLPYLMGERSPINDPNAKGMFTNLSLFYKRSDLVKAVIEGICFSLYDVYKVINEDGVNTKEARVIGGGSKSSKIMQMLADIFDINMKSISTSDGGALGAIILAMVGDNCFKDVYEAASILVKDKKTYYPDKEKHLRYEEKFKLYKEAYLKNKV